MIVQVIDVLHPGRPNVPKVSCLGSMGGCVAVPCHTMPLHMTISNGCCASVLQAELKEKLTKMYDVRDPNGVFVFGFRTQVKSSPSSHIMQ